MTLERRQDGNGVGLCRRRLLQTTALSLASLGLAGCSGITNQEFTAEPVAIPDVARTELGYVEQQREEKVIERTEEVSGVELSATIESYYATYAPDLEGAGDETVRGGERPASEMEARKQALFRSLQAAGESDLLSLPSMAAVSTPKGEVFGQKLNPLANRDLESLLQSDRASDLLANTDGGTNGSPGSLDWEREPEQVDSEDASLVGTDAEVQAFGGLVEGSDAPLFLLGTLARAVDESVVITAGTLALPVADPERDLVGGDGYLGDEEVGAVMDGAVAANEAIESE